MFYFILRHNNQNLIKLSYLSINFKSLAQAVLALIFFSFFTFESSANYLVTTSPGDKAGWYIKLNNDSIISKVPIVGPNNDNYYQIGDPIVLDKNSSNVSSLGLAKCRGYEWGTGDNSAIYGKNAYHRLFFKLPAIGSINSLTAYRINSNLILTVDSPIATKWTNIGAILCSLLGDNNPAKSISDFHNQFPISLTFYVNEHIIDGKIIIPETKIAGYVRAFTSDGASPTINNWPFEQSTAPMYLLPSQLNVKASCTTSSDIINLDHGLLSTQEYNSVVQHKLTYSCDFSELTKVKLRIDYAKDNDPDGRLSMNYTTPSGNVLSIYSDLMITDDDTGQTGRELTTVINKNKQITISSHLHGSRATAGRYHGSAWLIATYD